MTNGKQRVLEILKDFDTWCLCGKKECAKSENFIQALEGSGIPPAQNKDALQTNNKEKKV